MAFIGKRGGGWKEGVMTKRPIEKKGKLNIQCFSLKKKKKEEEKEEEKKKMLFLTKGKKSIECP